MQGGMKACYARNVDEAAKIAHRKWRASGVPGEVSQTLPTPELFEQVSQLVTPEMMRKEIACGPDPAVHLEQIVKYREAGFDEVCVAPVGPNDADRERKGEREAAKDPAGERDPREDREPPEPFSGASR
jgi:hypothetical protein